MRRWIYYALAILVMMAGVAAIAAQSRVGALPGSVDARMLDYPVRLNGIEASTRTELEFLAQRLEPGTAARLESPGRARAITIGRSFAAGDVLISAVCGFLFWGIAIFVFADRVRWLEAHLLFFGMLLYSIIIWVGSVYGPPAGFPWPAVRAASMPALSVIFVCLSLVFPRRHPVLERWPALLPAMLATGTAIGIWHALAFLRYAAAPGPLAAAAWRVPDRLSDLLLIVADTLGCWFLYRSTRRLELASEQRQSKWVLWGITIGVTPYAFLYVLPRLLGASPLVPLGAARLATVTIPAAFTIAVVKYRFLDIDLIIRRSVIYALLAGVMVGIYLLLGVAVGSEIRRLVPRSGELVSALAVAVPIILFAPTRRFIGRWVDRTFFKIRYGYEQGLRRLDAVMSRAASSRDVKALLETFLEENLAPRSKLIVTHDEDQRVAASPLADVSPAPGESSDPAMPFRRSIVALPGSTSVPEIETAGFPDALASLGYRLTVQLQHGQRSFGLILLGPKRSGWGYVEPDLEMLGRLAPMAAQALERVELMRRMFVEASERKRLDQLDRMKSEFLFRVAHDLRTPIASIAWSNRNLLDGVVGAVDDRQRSYLEGVDAAARQLERLVDNLLEVSRLEVGSERLTPEPVDLASAVREAASILAPLAAARQIRLETAGLAANLPPVRGHRGKLLQVLTNVMENAVKYSPPGSAVDVIVEATEGRGRQRVSVRDRGPGIPPEDRDRIFELHQQGEPSPYTSQRGFGLGLYVVKSYVGLMGGTVEASNHLDGGAIVACTFRTWTEEEP